MPVTCAECGTEFEQRSGRGRPRRFCDQACTEAHHHRETTEQRRAAAVASKPPCAGCGGTLPLRARKWCPDCDPWARGGS